MTDRTRREFLELAAILGGGLALGPRAAAAALEGAAPADGGGGEPDLALASWGGELADPDALAPAAAGLTEAALAALGGMGRFCGRGDTVWIKPNIAWNRPPALGATTHPEVVATLVRLCLEAGARKVKVGDHTCHDPRQSYRTSGIEAAAREAGAEVVQLDANRYREMDLGGTRIKRWPVYPEIVESDLVINVPVVKHHGLSRATLCMKNYMGVIGGRVAAWHQDLPTCLCDITRFMKPRLCVLDAVRILTAHGPQGGNPADVRLAGLVAAGTDIVALDAWGAEQLGHRPESLATVRAGAEAGLGNPDWRSLRRREVTVP